MVLRLHGMEEVGVRFPVGPQTKQVRLYAGLVLFYDVSGNRTEPERVLEHDEARVRGFGGAISFERSEYEIAGEKDSLQMRVYV